MNRRAAPVSLWIIAVLQFVAPLVFPPGLYSGIALPLWIAIAVVFVLVGVNLLRLKDWARVATIFVQGFSIIVRLLTLLSGVVPAGGAGANIVFLATSLISMALSGIILYGVDQPDIQLLMQQ